MVRSSRLNTELLNWLFNVCVTTTIAFLVISFPVLQSMSRLQKTPNMNIFMTLYAGPIGTLFVVLIMTLVLALLWHAPRMLAANIQRNRHWLDHKLANAIFAASAISAAILAKLAGQKCLDYNEQFYSSTVQFGMSYACGSDKLLSYAVLTIWSLMAAFSISYGFYLAWIGWNQRGTYQ